MALESVTSVKNSEDIS